MKKEIIIRAIKNLKEEEHKHIVWAEDLTEEQIVNIRQNFSVDMDVKDWIAVYDVSAGKKGKKGYLFAGEKLYGYNLKNALDWELLEAVLLEKTYRIWLIYKDGTLEHYDSFVYLKCLLPVIGEILGRTQAQEFPEKKYEYLRQDYRRELWRRLKSWTGEMNVTCRDISSVEICTSEVVKNAIENNAPQTSQEQVVAIIQEPGCSGKRATLVTMDAIYCHSYNKNGEYIQLDGLEKIYRLSQISYLLLYENGYIIHRFLSSEKKEEALFQKYIEGILKIYQQLHEEVQADPDYRFGLDVTGGWAAFEEKRQKNALDTYKNAVFVSSTFRDMHFERDMIHEKVQPSLNALAEKYGESLSFCDLRWGVNTEDLDSEEGAKKVLIVCLDEIERCDPYMLILLGERYGWIPNERTVKNALEGRPDFALDELEKSVTALEIEFGALTKHTSKERVFVYFREMANPPSDIYRSEDEFHKEKLAQLKKRVLKLVPDRVKSYTLSWNEQTQNMNGIEAFAQMVTEDIGSVMEKEWQSRTKRTPFEEEMAQHWSYAEKKAAQCYACDEFLKNCLKNLDENHHLMAVQGVSGCGKSTLMGALAVILRASNTEVFPLFCAHTEGTDTAIEIIQHMVYQLELLLDLPHMSKEAEDSSDERWIGRLNQLAEQYSKEKTKPLMFLIDAVDQLSPDVIRDNLKFIPSNLSALSSKVSMILSCLDDFELPGFPLVYQVPLLTADKKPQVISGILNRNRRELDNSVIEAITQKQGSDSPLYLMMLIQRLLMMNKNDFDDIASDGDGMSAITKHQLKIVKESGDTISEICRETIEMAAQRIGGDFVKTAIECIAVSRRGLREKDLEGLLTAMGIGWNRLEFSIFINYVHNIFVLREDGCYDFSHKVIRQEMNHIYQDSKRIHKQLVSWLMALPRQDHLREKELLYHCMEAHDSDAFLSCLKEVLAEKRDTELLEKDIVVHSRKDEGKWLSQVLAGVIRESMEMDFDFLHFWVYDILLSYGRTETDLNTRECLGPVLLEMAEYIREIDDSMESERMLGVMYSRLGNIYRCKRDPKAFEYYSKSLDESGRLLEKWREDNLFIDVAFDNYILGDTYCELGGDTYKEEALYSYQTAVQIAEEIGKICKTDRARSVLGWAYMKLGQFYDHAGEENEALKYYEACVREREALTAQNPAKTYIRNLCSAYDHVARKCKYDDPQRALELYKKMIGYLEKVVQEERTMDVLEDLAWAYSYAGYFLQKEKIAEEQLEALDYLERSIPIFEEYLSQYEDSYMQWTLCDNYGYAVRILGMLGGTENQLKVERYGKRGLYWGEYRAQKEQSSSAYDSWANMLLYYAGATTDVKLSIECLKKKIELNQVLYKMTKDKSYKKEIPALKMMINSKKLIKIL